MKFTLITFILVFSFIITPLQSVHGATTDNTALIQQLLAQIAILQQQLNELIAVQGGSVPSCTFTRLLVQGKQGQDVTCLQNYLKSKGYFSGTATGLYGPRTEAAVASWQRSQGMIAQPWEYGHFGEQSRVVYARNIQVKDTQAVPDTLAPSVTPPQEIPTTPVPVHKPLPDKLPKEMNDPVPSTSNTTQNHSKKILWQRCAPNENVQCDIWVMSEDKTEATNLTPSTDSSFDFDPQWSPDRTKIVFASTRGGNPDIYTMNADGTSITQLTTDAGFESWASFSPDGKQIVFSRAISGKLQLHTMNLDGSKVKRLTNNAGNDEEAAYSPDGTKIVFDSDRGGSYQLYTMNADGSNVTQLTSNNIENRYPSWSPDGTKIVFGGKLSATNNEVFTINADSSGLQKLTSNPHSINSDPAWSPDGTSIIFASTRDSNAEIYRMDDDGSNETRLTTDSAFDAGPFFLEPIHKP